MAYYMTMAVLLAVLVGGGQASPFLTDITKTVISTFKDALDAFIKLLTTNVKDADTLKKIIEDFQKALTDGLKEIIQNLKKAIVDVAPDEEAANQIIEVFEKAKADLQKAIQDAVTKLSDELPKVVDVDMTKVNDFTKLAIDALNKIFDDPELMKQITEALQSLQNDGNMEVFQKILLDIFNNLQKKLQEALDDAMKKTLENLTKPVTP